MAPTIPQSPNGGTHPELAAAASRAREALETFRTEDEAYVRGHAERPDYIGHCHALAAAVHRLLRLIDPRKENDDNDSDHV